MTTRLSLPSALLAAALGTLLGAFPGPARAQDGEARPPAEKPAAGAPDADRAASLLRTLEELYPRAAARPAPLDRGLLGNPESAAKERSRFIREKEAWESVLERIPEVALDYREAAGDDADPRAWFFSGFARVVHADRVGRQQGLDLLSKGAADLEVYLERAKPDAGFRADARYHHAYARLRLAGGEADVYESLAGDIEGVVRALLDEGRADEAGRLAYLELTGLVGGDREAVAARLAAAWDARSADFGASTPSVRRLARRAAVRPGAAMPELPELASYTGAPMPWGELAGKPYVLHFFSTTISQTPREVETILVPLRDKWEDAGLRLVGCSVDRELDDAEIARIRAYRDENSDVTPVEDGRKPSVRAWAEARGMDWPWYWDGKWMNTELAQHLGVEVNAPFAILVDRGGKIVWRGQPFEGLAEAVEGLMSK